MPCMHISTSLPRLAVEEEEEEEEEVFYINFLPATKATFVFYKTGRF